MARLGYDGGKVGTAYFATREAPEKGGGECVVFDSEGGGGLGGVGHAEEDLGYHLCDASEVVVM